MVSFQQNSSFFDIDGFTRSTQLEVGVSWRMKRNELQLARPGRAGADEELDEINARTRQKGPERIRRKVEASIEAKARKRRRQETPNSSAWKK